MPNQSSANSNAAKRRADYEAIIKQVEPDIIRTARRLCGGQEDRAQDLAQDALVKGYQAFIEGRFQPGTNARAWLLRILTNNFITEYNHKRKWDAGVDVDTLTAGGEIGGAAFQASPQDRPDTALLTAALEEPIENALAKLSPELRAAIILVDIEGAEYTEAAAALHVPIGTVRSRLSRARMQLHALLYNYARERRRA